MICGIVDRDNSSPNLSYQLAADHGLVVRRLPIQEHVQNYTKLVLNIDSVVKILFTFCKAKCWKTAIEENIAIRHLKPS
jgi:hypothetical protein